MMIREPQASLFFEVNRKVAAIYLQEPREIKVVFVPMIKREQVLVGTEIITTKQTLGDCDIQSGLIRLVRRDNWGNTYIHELVHLYNPTRGERWVRKAVKDVIRLWKQGGLWDR